MKPPLIPTEEWNIDDLADIAYGYTDGYYSFDEQTEETKETFRDLVRELLSIISQVYEKRINEKYKSS